MRRLVSVMLAAVLSGSVASKVEAAACTTSGDPAAIVLPIDEPGVGAPLLVNLGVWLGVVSKRGLNAKLSQMREGCERLRFEARGSVWVLRGESGETEIQRLAAPVSKGRVMAYVMAVPDIAAAISQNPPAPAPISGYALMTADGGRHTAWRVYDRAPADEVLGRDMAEALAGRMSPRMHWRDGKAEIVVSKRRAEN